jgi:hypothetical protein
VRPSLGWGCRSCRHRRRGRWWRGVGRGGRAPGRWPRSRPRTAGDRAVLLAQLLGGGQAVEERQGAHRRGVPLGGEDAGQRLGRGQVGVGRGDGGVVALDEGHPAPGELHHGLVAAGLGEVAERLHGQVVVLLVEVVATGVGDREDLRRAPAPTVRRRPGVARLELPLGQEVLEMTAYGGGRQVEALGQRRGGRGPVHQDRPDDALTRRLVAGVVPLEFHNTSVPLIPRSLQVRLHLPSVSPAGRGHETREIVWGGDRPSGSLGVGRPRP